MKWKKKDPKMERSMKKDPMFHICDEEGSHVSHKYLILLDNKLCIVKSYEFKFLQELIVQHDMVSKAY